MCAYKHNSWEAKTLLLKANLICTARLCLKKIKEGLAR